MAITRVSREPTTVTVTSDPTALDYPPDSEFSAGDYMTANFVVGRGNTSDPWFTSASDDGTNTWTEIDQFTHVNADTVAGVYGKEADSDDADGTNTVVTALPNAGALYKVGWVQVFSGVNLSNPVNTFSAGGTTDGTSPTTIVIPELTTTVDGCYIYVLLATEVSDKYSSMNTSGWTADASLGAAAHSFGRIFTKDGGQPTAGGTGDFSIELSPGGKVSWVAVAIEPDAGGGGGGIEILHRRIQE